jgi:hypothetical protein
MSRNFEVLEQLQQDRELFHVPPIKKAAPGSGEPTDSKVSPSDPDAFVREEILKLVRCLFFAPDGLNVPKRVVFCGIDEIHGSNLLCARVARSLAEQVHSQVCVVDANASVPEPRPLFDLAPPDRSTQWGYGATRKSVRRITDNLWLASTDSLASNSGTRILDDARAWIRDLGDKFAYLVISAPPLGLYSDAALLGQMADGVVLVLEANCTRRAVARRVKGALAASNVKVLGTVLNNRTFPIPESIYRRL